MPVQAWHGPVWWRGKVGPYGFDPLSIAEPVGRSRDGIRAFSAMRWRLLTIPQRKQGRLSHPCLRCGIVRRRHLELEGALGSHAGTGLFAATARVSVEDETRGPVNHCRRN